MVTTSSPDGTRKVRILCAGIAALDHIYRIERFSLSGDKLRAKQFTVAGGGCCGNGAIAAARLGAQVSFAGPLGQDAIGDEIIARLRHEGIDTQGTVRLAQATSSLSAILVDADGERQIINHRDDALAEGQPADPSALVAKADAVLIDNRFPEFSLAVAQAARERDLIVVLDADEPTRHTASLFDLSTHVVFSAGGLRATVRDADPAQALIRLGAQHPTLFAVTDGPNGTLWHESGAIHRYPAFDVEAIDTLGAGDVFHGAVVLALAEGHDFTSAARFAAAAAAIKCTRFGGISGAPARGEVEQFLRDDRARKPLALAE